MAFRHEFLALQGKVVAKPEMRNISSVSSLAKHLFETEAHGHEFHLLRKVLDYVLAIPISNAG